MAPSFFLKTHTAILLSALLRYPLEVSRSLDYINGTHVGKANVCRGGSMFEATDKAVEMLKEYLKQGDIKSAVRILMAGGG
jgi:hypothetical protein